MKNLSLIFMLSGCVYKFSNLHSSPPVGIKTIAVEAVYDTSRYPFSHSAFWNNVQKAIAANGFVRVVDRKEADSLLRMHLFDFTTFPSGQVNTIDSNIDEPKVEEFVDNPPSFYQFRDLTTPQAFYPRSTYGITVRAEVWNLKTRALVLQRLYSFTREFDAVRTEVPTEINGLRYHEAESYVFERIGEQLGGQVVADILSQ